MHDAAIIGGGVAGLQAALTLARFCYRIVLIDAGKPNHAVAPQMHNMIGADGVTPEEFYRRAHAQLDAYPHLERVAATVVDGSVDPDYSFRLLDDAGRAYHARTVLFACGIRDVLPPIDGIAECWGREVLHCAYCHGYEARGKRTVLRTPAAAALVMVNNVQRLSSQIHVLLEDGPPDAELAAQLQRRKVTWGVGDVQRVERVTGGLRLYLADAAPHDCEVMYIRPGGAGATALPTKFGCTMPYGSQIQMDAWGMTGIAGVYAAGDVATGVAGQLVAAMKSGVDAAVRMHRDLASAACAQ